MNDKERSFKSDLEDNRLILNGWISPQGEIFECGKMQHMDVAQDIAIAKGMIDKEGFIDYDEMIQKHKYIKFFNPHDDRDGIFFVLSSSYRIPDIEPTQKQIMAMGRLEKALIKTKKF